MNLIDPFAQDLPLLKLVPDSSEVVLLQGSQLPRHSPELSLALYSANVASSSQRVNSLPTGDFVFLRVLPKPNVLVVETARVLGETRIWESRLYAAMGMSGLASIVIAFVRAYS